MEGSSSRTRTRAWSFKDVAGTRDGADGEDGCGRDGDGDGSWGRDDAGEGGGPGTGAVGATSGAGGGGSATADPASIGSSITNVAPPPGVGSWRSDPPWAAMMPNETDSPRPVP